MELRISRVVNRVLFLALGFAWLPSAAAMEFRLFFQPDLRINVLIAEGPIVTGDAERFLAASTKADRDVEGHIVLVLNSLGGSVQAAFDFVRAMDRVGVFTIVPDNALCASACASIIYPSGIRRNIVGSGRLGFHSCYTKVEGKIDESAFCNEKIAEHAISRGVAHASVNLFVKDFGAGEMAWVDRHIVCTTLPGMCRPTLRDPRPSVESEIRPSFDCAKSRTLVEKLICANPVLAKMDARMAVAYFTLSTSLIDQKSLLDEQRAWLRNDRNNCDSLECLVAAYQSRIGALESRIGQ
ncbi:lysozyme inhibitor LprI family protein [Ramlibacter sp. 2FC]|uniref:lysozyme inhibitor LprI family protein n=1 Tax=Ramlibacter sp. 2FC TaxID=2502188 RepID=UPI001485596C|nr:lysozyme inhibitor LprI family protein [Ramlibacter sp. 2FC]